MSTKEQQDRLWWEWTRSRGRTAYLWHCAVVDGLAQGAFVYLLVRGLGMLFGGPSRSDEFAGAFSAVFFPLFYALWAYIGGVFKWDRYTRKYTPPPPPSDAPNTALQVTARGGGVSAEFNY